MSGLVWKTGRAKRAAEEAERKAKLREWQIQIHLDGTRDKVLAETGVDLLAGTEWGAPLPAVPSADGGAGREQEHGSFDTRSSSEMLSDWIRRKIAEGKEQRAKIRQLPGGIPDARLIPDDPNQGSFEDRNLWS